jgi:hypothetical protein
VTSIGHDTSKAADSKLGVGVRSPQGLRWIVILIPSDDRPPCGAIGGVVPKLPAAPGGSIGGHRYRVRRSDGSRGPSKGSSLGQSKHQEGLDRSPAPSLAAPRAPRGRSSKARAFPSLRGISPRGRKGVPFQSSGNFSCMNQDSRRHLTGSAMTALCQKEPRVSDVGSVCLKGSLVIAGGSRRLLYRLT